MLSVLVPHEKEKEVEKGNAPEALLCICETGPLYTPRKQRDSPRSDICLGNRETTTDTTAIEKNFPCQTTNSVVMDSVWTRTSYLRSYQIFVTANRGLQESLYWKTRWIAISSSRSLGPQVMILGYRVTSSMRRLSRARPKWLLVFETVMSLGQ